MAEPFLTEIRLFSFNFPPKGWAFCNGQLLPINQNQAMFALLGTTYGGNGQTNFALPNLQGRTPIHTGNGHTLGEAAGQEAHTLSISEIPTHTHYILATNNKSNTTAPSSSAGIANSVPSELFNSTQKKLVAMHPEMVTSAGGSQAHTNMQPYLALNYCIALQGIFPSPN